MNLRKLFGKKEKAPEQRPDPCIPPTAAEARRRLMVLWANEGRSFLEQEYADDPSEGEGRARDLRTWLNTSLHESATAPELARHAMPFGSWPQRFVIDDWWDHEAAVAVQWALGLSDSIPCWDVGGELHEATQEFFEFPEPSAWYPILTLRDPEEIEQMAQSYEARYWRIRVLDQSEDHTYARKLMGRAQKLGQVDLAPDGDLAMSDGTSILDADADHLALTTSIVIRRLHALNWLCGHDPDWDMIACNTIVGWLWDENW